MAPTVQAHSVRITKVHVVQASYGVSVLGDTHKLFGCDLREVEAMEKPGQTRIILKEPYEKCKN